MVPIKNVFCHLYYMVTFFSFLNNSLIFEYNVLMFLISLSRLVMISLINLAVFIYIGWIIH